MDIIEQSRDFFRRSSDFRQITVFLWKPIWHEEHKNDKMLLSTILLKHASPIRRVLYICLESFDCLMQLFCITAVRYGGLYRTFYDRFSTQYFVKNSRPTSAKIKTTAILGCKLRTQSKHVKIYDTLRISFNESSFSIKSVTRTLVFILIRSMFWHFCDGIKLSDSCR